MADILSALLGFGGNMFDTFVEGRQTIANNTANMHIADQNLAFQRELLQYQQGLQQEIFGREDNAVQRRAADMEAAGINPILAAGAPAQAGAVVSTQAPQNQMKFNATARTNMGALGDIIPQILQVKATQASIAQSEADARRTNAEADAIESQTPIKTAGLELANQLSQGSLKGQELDNAAKEINNILNASTLTDKVQQADLLTKQYGADLFTTTLDQALKESQKVYVEQQTSESKQRVLESKEQVKQITANTNVINLKKLEQEVKTAISQALMNTTINSQLYNNIIKIAQIEILKSEMMSKRLNVTEMLRPGLTKEQMAIIQKIIPSFSMSGTIK